MLGRVTHGPPGFDLRDLTFLRIFVSHRKWITPPFSLHRLLSNLTNAIHVLFFYFLQGEKRKGETVYRREGYFVFLNTTIARGEKIHLRNVFQLYT